MRCVVMAGLVPAIHVLLLGAKNVDARDKPGHDGRGRIGLHVRTKKKSRLWMTSGPSLGRKRPSKNNPNRIAAKERSRKALAYL
ncbi:hypothetical protein FBZ96_104815 [Bradyrhizobium stylosanthis]|uniref:Uncharacterized protein n=1 Tax=Bradyrhizobium stylosanthis TaxID=1803665 RepID=A0A560DRV7_9BRAD|nr:hypothetical protein FBZ96_104815 [Bradyrhizobium stylosanthis]